MSPQRKHVGVVVLICLALGAAIGFFLFWLVIARDTRLEIVSSIAQDATRLNVMHDKFSGVVLDHNETARSILVNIPNSFPSNESGVSPIRLQYTADTKWFAVEYIFSSGVMIQRRVSEVAPRTLPKDALVSVILYHNGYEFQTIGIAYLRRINI